MPELLAEDEYPEEGRSFVGKSQDEWLLLIRGWLKNPLQRPEGLTDKQYLSFTRFAKGFFVDKENTVLYSAPPIPAGIQSFQWNSKECSTFNRCHVT